MELQEATDLIRLAVPPEPGNAVWADFGAGSGTFTRALAGLLGPQARIFAVDRDPRAMRELRSWAAARDEAEAAVVPVHGDFRDLRSIHELAGVQLDGALLSNALHFAADADLVLVRVAQAIRPGGRLVVVEYEGRPPSRWVPYPISLERLHTLATRANLSEPVVSGRHPSAYGGMLYCAFCEKKPAATV